MANAFKPGKKQRLSIGEKDRCFLVDNSLISISPAGENPQTVRIRNPVFNLELALSVLNGPQRPAEPSRKAKSQ